MNQLIKIKNENGKRLVSARELHEFLGLSKRFSSWFETYSKNEDYGFVENEDYMGCTQKYIANQYGAEAERQDYAITINMAKELSMLSKTDKGSQARKYFIQCEKELKENVQALNTSELSPELQMFKQIFDTVAKQQLENKELKKNVEETKAQIQETKEEMQGIRDIVSLSPNAWRKDTTNLINQIARKLGGIEHIKEVREESYKQLNENFGVNIQQRLKNKQKNMALEGVSKTKINNTNCLDVIADDKKLINGYVAIIGKMAIKNGI